MTAHWQNKEGNLKHDVFLPKSHLPFPPRVLDDCSCSVPSLDLLPDQPGPHCCRQQKTYSRFNIWRKEKKNTRTSACLICALQREVLMCSHSTGHLSLTLNQMRMYLGLLLFLMKGWLVSSYKQFVQTTPSGFCWPDRLKPADTWFHSDIPVVTALKVYLLGSQ